MLCEACVKVPYHGENDDCIGRALDVIKKHYTFYKNALQQRDLDVQRLKERNEKLNKALLLLKENQHPAKRVKSQTSYDSSKENNIPHEKRDCSDYSPTDDETTTVSNLNMALNSEQLFDSSALSQTKNNISITSSEMVRTRRLKESPKRNKQLDAIRIRRSKSEWHTKERYIPADKSWALKFLQSPKTNALDEREQTMKPTDKKLRLSLKKNNPSKMKQSLIQFNKSKDSSFREVLCIDREDDVSVCSFFVYTINQIYASEKQVYYKPTSTTRR